MSEPSILTAREGGLLILTLNRPDKLNALTAQMLDELRDALLTAERETDIRAVLMTGAGRAFVAGQDLSAPEMNLEGNGPDIGHVLDAHYHPVIRAMRDLPKPVVCAVNGIAAGAGANLALQADIVIAGRSAAFLQAFQAIGLIPDAGGTWMLPRLVGRARALGLSLLGEKLPAEEAASWGLIWKVVDDDELMDTARRIAVRLAEGPTKAYGAMKQAIDRSAGNSLADQLALEAATQQELGKTNDFREGVSAFLEKRKAEFRGS
ncbi:MAG: 2-(1,2-epoxy-1,2-dihydrophenyl)acetyl-CoA isomerase PaaG [Magnetovibrionaceae bacterium]